MEQGTTQMHTMQDPERYGMRKDEQSSPHSLQNSRSRKECYVLTPSPAQVHINQVYYPPPGTTNAYGYNSMPMAEVAQPPPNMYSYAGMPMAEAALAPPPVTQVHRSSGWCTCCCGPCARWSRKCWVILILIVVVTAFVLVVALVLTVAVQNGKDGRGYGG
jgi:hypothetical protein